MQSREIRAAYHTLASHARLVKEVNLMTYENASRDRPRLFKLFSYDLKPDLDAYLAALKVTKVRTLEEVIQFNTEHKQMELPPGLSPAGSTRS